VSHAAALRPLRSIRLTDRLVPVTCHVCVGSAEAFTRWVARRFAVPLDSVPQSSGLAFIDTPKVAGGTSRFHGVIWIEKLRRGNVFDMGRLAHEALHVTWRLLEKYGIEDEELHCYLVQWLVEEALHRLQ
jgi:hypothetical protein